MVWTKEQRKEYAAKYAANNILSRRKRERDKTKKKTKFTKDLLTSINSKAKYGKDVAIAKAAILRPSLLRNHKREENAVIHIRTLVENREYIIDLMRRKNKSCVYCGDYYQCRDHVIPVSWTGLPRKYSSGDVVPSCNECNLFLSNRPIFNIPERADYLIAIYQRKRLHFFKFPKWSDKEVSDLGYNIRLSVERRAYLQKVYEAKIANLGLVANCGEPVPL